MENMFWFRFWDHSANEYDPFVPPEECWYNNETIVDATRRGDIQKLKYIHHVDKHVIPTVPELPNIAAVKIGNCEILCHLQESNLLWYSDFVFIIAKEFNQMETLSFF